MARAEACQNVEIREGGLSFLSILKSVLIAIVFTVLLLLVFAFVVTYSNMPSGSEAIIVSVVSIVSVIIAGILNAKKARKHGWLNGLIAGIVYMAVLYLTGFLAFGPVGFSKQTVSMLVLGALAGAVGGIIGINLKVRRKK